MVKKWGGEKIKEVAERTLTGWLIKAEAAQADPAGSAAETTEHQADPAEAGKQEAEADAEPDPQSGAMLKFIGKVDSPTYLWRDLCLSNTISAPSASKIVQIPKNIYSAQQLRRA